MNLFDTPITDAAKERVMDTLNSGRLSEGEVVKAFEVALGIRHGVAVNSGTSALHLALLLAGVGKGDEVILPAQTFVATGLAVLYCGAKPVFADIKADGNIDPEDAYRKVTDKTKAVIAVSWGGNPCDVGVLQNRVDKPVIQDNAQAFGATLNELPLWEHGDFSCYSFQAIKALSTGDGGLLSCPDHKTYERAKRLRWFGIDRDRNLAGLSGERRYNLTEVGYKYHMNDYSAALGLGNLEGFSDRQARVKVIADYYNKFLFEFAVKKKEGCSYWLYDLLVQNRSDFIRAMADRGIPTSVVHVGIDRNDIFGWQDLPVQRQWDACHVCIPIHAGLTDEDVENVVKGVLAGW